MKYIRKFQTTSDYNAATIYRPSVSLIGETGGFAYDPSEPPCVKFIAKQANSTVGLSNISSNQTLEYSTDGKTWSSMTTGTTITLANSDDSVYVRGVLSSNNTSSDYTKFAMSGNIKVSGNINTLWDKNNPDAALKQYCGYRLFNECTALTDVSELILGYPTTTLANNCYEYMFYYCSSLTTAPQLPATTLANNCYGDMFNGCSSLTTAPQLPATTLAMGCYGFMFFRCTSLTTAPELPATTLPRTCYFSMFEDCTNLNYIKCLATDISATQCTYRWVANVAATGTFVKDASVTGWRTGPYGIPEGWTVQDA